MWGLIGGAGGAIAYDLSKKAVKGLTKVVAKFKKDAAETAEDTAETSEDTATHKKSGKK